jgi:MarR family transcriptional regulator, organic hydroperoxide resistance regulator
MAVDSDSRASLQTRSWFAVVLAYQTCERQYARLLDGFGFTIAQFDVLSAIEELGDRATPVLIAQRLLVTKGNISGLLKRLAENGLIRLTPNPADGRSQLCRLGAGVAPTLTAAKRASAAFIAEQLSPFSDAQLTATEVQMTRMRQHLESMDTDRLVAQSKGVRRVRAA